MLLPFVTMLPSAKPAIPKIATWESDTIPPYAERKMRLDAATPRNRAWVRIVLTKYADMSGVETRAGASTAKTRAAPPIVHSTP